MPIKQYGGGAWGLSYIEVRRASAYDRWLILLCYKRDERMQCKAKSGEEAECTCEYMSIPSLIFAIFKRKKYEGVIPG